MIVPFIGKLPAFVAVKAGIFPTPLAPKPIAGFEFVHAKVPPVGALIKLVAATIVVLHTVTLAGTVTVGGGLIVTESVVVKTGQLPFAGIV